MILCLTPNPALDHTLIVPALHPGEVHRASRAMITAGGKGLNVARALRTLGGDPLCLGFLGGHSGRLLAELAEREGLSGAWTWTAGETRTCVIIAPEHGGEATVINEGGPKVSAHDWAALSADVRRQAASAQLVCVSGSLPQGSPAEAFAALLRELCAVGKTVWVDASGPALAAALAVTGIRVKANGDEIGGLLNQTVNTAESARMVANALRERGVRQAVITLGSEGAVMVNDAGAWRVRAPDVSVVSAVGSGDAFLAGLVLAHSQGCRPDEALRWAAAAGAANALTVGGGRLTLADFRAALAATALAEF
jgi:1-phosphofructokinase family hexose kinase